MLPTRKRIGTGHYEVNHNGQIWTVKSMYFLGAVHWLGYAPGDTDTPSVDRPTLSGVIKSIARRRRRGGLK